MVLRNLLTSSGSLSYAEHCIAIAARLSIAAIIAWISLACGQMGDLNQGSSQKEPPGMEALLGDSFLPSPSEEQLKKEHALAAELARTIERLDGVDEARVHLNLADRSLLARDRRTDSRAAILIRRGHKTGLDETEVRSLAAAAISGLEPDKVKVFFSGPSKPPISTIFIGPIEVAESSAVALKLCLGSLLGLCLILALTLVVAGLKLRGLRRSKR
ncbi:MAG: hypothetical protein GY847_04005 [Proteobacteria bacterium]|nr:hypothetical protein [Pseudomonadota bacterium]